MSQIFHKDGPLDFTSTVNLLMTPISELGLNDAICKFLRSCEIQYCYNILEWSEEKLFSRLGCYWPGILIGRMTPVIFELQRVIWHFKRRGFSMGTLNDRILKAIRCAESAHALELSEAILLGGSLKLGAGNHHAANPRSQTRYDGPTTNGEW